MKNWTRALLTIVVTMTAVLTGCSDQPDEQAMSYLDRSKAYEKQGQYRAAMIELRNAIQAAPDNSVFLIQYAELLNKLGSPGQAEEVIRARNADLPAARPALVESLLAQGKYVSAGQILDSWQPDADEQLRYNQLQAWRTYFEGNTAEAFEQYRALMKENDFKTSVQYIDLLIQQKELNEAERWLAEVSQKNPENGRLLLQQAKVAFLKDDLTGAEERLTEALGILPSTDILISPRADVLELLSEVLTLQGRADEALIYSRIIREGNPEGYLARQQYEEAVEAATQGDLTSAKKAFEDILSQFPDNREAALMLGLINLQQGDLETGESLLSENLVAEIAPVTIIQATAIAQSEQGKSAEALDVLEKALLARPDDVTLLGLYGIISINNDMPQQGIKAIRKALQLDPQRTRLHLLMAQYYVEQSDSSLALEHLRKAYDQDATDWPTTRYYLQALLNEGERGEAMAIREELAADYPDNQSALWLVAMADYQLGNMQSALNTLTGLHQSAPENLNVINVLARLYTQQEQFTRAEAMWLKAIEIAPENESFLSQYVITKNRTVPRSELADSVVKTAELQPTIAGPLHSVAIDLMIDQKRYSDAQALAKPYNSNQQPYAQRIRASLLRGDAIQYANEQRYSDAIDAVNAAIALSPDNPKLVQFLAELQVQNNDYGAALASYDRALRLAPESLRLINGKARLIAQAQDSMDAMNYLKPFWLRQPQSGLAQTYFSLVNQVEPEQMETALRQLLNAEPDNTEAMVALGGLLLADGEKAAAETQYRNALAVNPEYVPALNNLAWIIRDSQPDAALKFAEKAAELAPNSASVLDTYGWILHLNGQSQKAASILDKALEIEPENTEIQNHRSQI